MSAAQRKVDSENIPVVAYMFSEPLVHLKPDGNIKPLTPTELPLPSTTSISHNPSRLFCLHRHH